MKRRFFVVSDFKQTDTGSYMLLNHTHNELNHSMYTYNEHVWRDLEEFVDERFMNEELLVDLIRDIDVSLLEDNFILQDIECNRGNIISNFYQEKAKIIDIDGRFDITIKAVKNKMNYLAGIVSGIAAAIVLIGAAVAWLIKKTAIQQN